jgi:GNAT superfamily N-acetyltransferase
MRVSTVVANTLPLQEAALSLLFSPLPPDQRERQVADAFAAVDRHEFSFDNLIVALDGRQVVGAVLAVRRPGAAAFLWPPAARGGADEQALAVALLQTVASRVDAQGVKFTQCLLDLENSRIRATLERGGFPYVTDLVLLSRSLRANLSPATEKNLAPFVYSDALHSSFAHLVERTYDGTLDCPILARFRGGSESLEAHRATGKFSPEAWRLYRSQGVPVGVLLLAEHPERDVWEVAYLGVVPEARGRGFGRAILHDGLALAKESGRATIEIAVDAENSPALRIYREAGFTEVRRFAVHLRIKEVPSTGFTQPPPI